MFFLNHFAQNPAASNHQPHQLYTKRAYWNCYGHCTMQLLLLIAARIGKTEQGAKPPTATSCTTGTIQTPLAWSPPAYWHQPFANDNATMLKLFTIITNNFKVVCAISGGIALLVISFIASSGRFACAPMQWRCTLGVVLPSHYFRYFSTIFTVRCD